MKTNKTNLIATILVTGSVSAAAPATAMTPATSEAGVRRPYAEAVTMIEDALNSVKKNANAAAQAAKLKEAADAVASRSGGNQLVQLVLADARVSSNEQTDPSRAAATIRAALIQAAEILRFKPIAEAPLPEGFPELTPVGEIRVNRYPAYRLARTPMERGQDRAFWTLFKHIQSNEIAMTAPVEVTYDADRRHGPKGTAMAFLYRNTGQGELGADDNVEVQDAPAQTAVSIGWRGDMTRSNVRHAHEILAAWLKQHANEYEPCGELRVMGYNSPMIPVDERFFEVQIPVRPKQ